MALESDKGTSIPVGNASTNDGESGCGSSTYKRESHLVSQDSEASCYSVNRVSSNWGDSSLITNLGLPHLETHADAENYNSRNRNSFKSLLDDHFSDIKVDPVSTRGVFKPSSSGANYETKYDASPLVPMRKDRMLLEPPLEEIFFDTSDEKNFGETTHPTGMVVLKPNLEKDQRVEGSFRSKGSFCNEGFRKSVSHEASEISRCTRRHALDEFDDKSCCFRGRYSRSQNLYHSYCSDFGVESGDWRCPYASFNAHGKFGLEAHPFKLPLRGSKSHRYSAFNSFGSYGGEFGVESEMFHLPSSCTKCCKYMSCSSTEWSANMTKERVLERWKVTDRFRELEFGYCRKTFEAIPNGEALFEHLNPKSNHDITTESRFCGYTYNRSAVSDAIGINSCDGWKVNNHRILSRSRSFPPAGGGRSQRKGLYNSAASRNRRIALSKLQTCGRNRHVKETKEKCALPYYSSSRIGLSLSGKCRHFNLVCAQFELKMEASIKDFCGQPCMIQMSARDVTVVKPLWSVRDTEINSNLSSKVSVLHPIRSSSVDNEINHTSHKEDLLIQNHQANMTSSDTSKGAEDSNAVLSYEAAFDKSKRSEVENISEMNELHEKPRPVDVQTLQCPTSLSCSFASNLDLLQVTRDFTPDVEGWECSYALKVLARCGIDKAGLDKICALWHMPDPRRNPSLYDKIEKKYGDGTTRLISERMLILDRINFAIMDRFRQQVDIYPWVKPRVAGIRSHKDENALAKLIRQESADGWVPERLRFDPEVVWRDSDRVIEVIGIEIELSLTDDLLTEFLHE